MDDRPILLFDRSLHLKSASAAAFERLGVTPGQRCREVLGCPVCPGDACPLRQALAGESAAGPLPNGAIFLSAHPLQGEAGVAALLTLRGGPAEPVTLGIGLQRVLDVLRALLKSDLAALAFYDPGLKEIQWQVTSGNLSPAVTAIRLRPGQGFAGRIVLTDLPLRTFRFPEDLTADPESYPIFLAEGLKAAVGVPVRGEDGVLGVLMVGSRSEREYSDEDLERLKGVADSISLAAEMMRLHEEALRRERTRLAHEVHDGLSQNLFGLQLLLQDLQQSLRVDPPEQVERGLREVCTIMDTTLSEVRRLIGSLRGTVGRSAGLIGALTEYLTHFYRLSALVVELATGLQPGEEVTCSDPQEVLRIVQEALMNVHRHAGASRIRVEVGRTADGYLLVIEDDGCGFDPSQPPAEGHYGLQIMQERAVRIGATLAIESTPGSGTRLRLQLPL